MSSETGNEQAFEDKVVNGLKEDRLTGIKVSLSHPGHTEKFFKLAKKAKKLATVEVSGSGIDESSGKYIAECVAESKSITYLAIRRSKMGPKDLITLSEALKTNPTLRTLILHNNQSSWGEFDGPANAFAAVLAKNTSLTRFDMTAHRVRDGAAANLCGMLSQNKTLTYLDLSENPMSDAGLSQFLKGVSLNHTLKHLLLCKLSLSSQLAELATGALLTNTALGRLALDGNSLSLKMAERLSAVFDAGKLTFIQLNECKLGDDGAAVFFRLLSSQNCNLRKLHLNDNGISKVDAVDWENAHWCNELSLNNNPIGNAGARRIAKGLRLNRGFVTLNLVKCDIKDDGVKELSDALQDNPTLTALSLSVNDGGRGLTADANKLLVRNENIKKLLDNMRKNDPATAARSPSVATQSTPNVAAVGRTASSWSPPSIPLRDLSADVAQQKQAAGELVFLMGRRVLNLGRLGLAKPEGLAAVLRDLVPTQLQVDVSSALLHDHAFTIMPVVPLLPLKSLTYLDLSFGTLTSIPEDIARLKTLVTLDLRCNALSTLPPQLGQLRMLSTLLLQQNQLSSLPSAVLQSTQLENIGLAGNQIPFPLDLLYPQWNHKRVDLSKLKLKKVPMELFSMPSVEELLLNDNELVGLPQEIANLKLLRQLDLSNNQLQSLPWQLGQLSSLRNLNLKGNLLAQIPEELLNGNLSNLLTFLIASKNGSSPLHRMKLMLVGEENVGKTSLTNVIRECWAAPDTVGSQKSRKRGDDDKKDKKADKKKEAVKDSGKGSSGNLLSPDGSTDAPRKKNSVDLEAMTPEQQAQFEATIKTVSTDGIAVHEVIAPVGEGLTAKEYRFAVWDFAGQEVYYSTHSFFISKRSLFLIIFNMSEPIETSAKRIDYWLQVVSSRAGGSPALLVGTHLDSKKCTAEYVDQVRNFLVQRYNKKAKSLQGISFVSCKTRKRVRELLDEIVSIASKQKHMHEEMPNVYASLEDQCKLAALSLSPPLVTLEKFAEMAARCGIAKGEVPGVLELLNQMGTLIHFKKDPTATTTSSAAVASALENLVVLDPMWLASIFKSIITFKHNFVENGMLAHRNAVHIWKDQPPAMHRVFLEILEKFEIAFPMSRAYKEPGTAPNSPGAKAAEEERSLIPNLLPEEAPNLAAVGWVPPPKGVITRLYEVPFVPLGLMGRLLVRALSFAHGNAYWRSGMLVSQHKGSTLALVTSNGSTQVALKCFGKDPGSLISVLDSNMLNLLDYVFKVDYEALALCVCSTCAAAPEKAHRFPMASIMTACTQGEKSKKCPQSGQDQDLGQIAPDLSVAELAALTVPYKDLKLDKELGRGAFSVVYMINFRGQQAAVKKLIQEGESTRVSGFTEFRREAWAWQKLQHPTLVRLLGLCWQPFCFIMEVVPYGELPGYLRSAGPKNVPWSHKLKIASDIATALNYMHSHNPPIMHRDVKSFNVLLAAKDPKAPVMAKLADFGLAFVGHQTIGRHVDNPVWLAVEVMAGREYTYKADIYSLGIILWELVACAEPFKEFGLEWLSELEDRILQGLRPSFPDDTPEPYRLLASACWHEDPRQRPNADEVLKTLATFKF